MVATVNHEKKHISILFLSVDVEQTEANLINGCISAFLTEATLFFGSFKVCRCMPADSGDGFNVESIV